MSVRILEGDALHVLQTLPDCSVQCCVTGLTETQIAYLAGLIDGEGCIETQRHMQRKSATPAFKLRIGFTFGTAEPITTVAGWLGGAPKVYPPTSPNRSHRWRFSIPKEIAVPLLKRMLPYLILKRRQAELLLAIEVVRATNSVPRTVLGPRSNLRMPSVAVAEMEILHRSLRSLKSNKRRVACR